MAPRVSCVRHDEAVRRRRHARGQAPPVLGVEVPAPAGRLLAVHEKAGPPPHLAVEELHAQVAAIRGPAPELPVRADEAVVVADLDRRRRHVGEGLERVAQAPLARLGDHDPLEGPLPQRAQQLAGDRTGVVRILVADIAHGDAARPQPLGEGPHAGENEGDLLLVVTDIGRLLPHLGHEDEVAGGVEVAQGRQPILGELVAEDEAEGAKSLAGHTFVMERRLAAREVRSHI